MSRPSIRLVRQSPYQEQPAWSEDRDCPEQLSLFDFKPKSRLVCLAMSNLHGETFQRVVFDLRPRATIDLRKFPYFDLVGINRHRALETLAKIASPYFHFPLELRAPLDHTARWKLRESAFSALSNLPSSIMAGETTLMAFVNDMQDVEILDNSLRHSHDGMTWDVEPAAFL